MTLKEKYLAAGLKLMPSGQMNNYQLVKLLGRLGTRRDSTWIRSPQSIYRGHHSCCGSKRDYYHKVSCPHIKQINSDDYSDLKDPDEKRNQ